MQVLGNYTDGIQAALPWNFLPCSVSALQHQTAPPKGQWVRKASPGWFGEISAAICSQNSSIAGEQHWATCAGSLCNNPRFPHVLFGALCLKMILYWNKLVICRNYCNDARNHKLQTWISDCFQLNTHNGSILRQLAFVKLITVYVYHSVLLGTIKTACVTQGKGHRNQIQNICIACSQGSQHDKGVSRCWDFGGVGVALPQVLSGELKTHSNDRRWLGPCTCAAEDRWLTATPSLLTAAQCILWKITAKELTLWKTFAFVMFIVQSLVLLLNCIMS